MRQWRLLYHVHTSASFDSWTKPASIIRYCVKHHIDWLAVTDHDNANNLLALENLGEKSGVWVIPAIEYSTDSGDIIGLFMRQAISSRNFNDVLATIHQQGGLAVLPHPYRGHDVTKLPIAKMDLIEIHNPRVTVADNQAAKVLADKYNKPILAGADAHFASELGLAVTVFQGADDSQEELRRPSMAWAKTQLLQAPREFHGKLTSQRLRTCTRLVKGIKLKKPKLVLEQLAWLLIPNLFIWLRRKRDKK